MIVVLALVVVVISDGCGTGWWGGAGDGLVVVVIQLAHLFHPPFDKHHREIWNSLNKVVFGRVFTYSYGYLGTKPGCLRLNTRVPYMTLYNPPPSNVFQGLFPRKPRGHNQRKECPSEGLVGMFRWARRSAFALYLSSHPTVGVAVVGLTNCI